MLGSCRNTAGKNCCMLPCSDALSSASVIGSCRRQAGCLCFCATQLLLGWWGAKEEKKKPPNVLDQNVSALALEV